MKQALCCLTAVLLLTVLANVGAAVDQREAKPAFKGMELYSWQDKDGNWVYVLLLGTNRIKTEEEVKADKAPIKGSENLKQALGRLAVGEHVAWVEIKGCAYPPKATRQEIEKAAKNAQIDLGYSTRGE